MKKRILAGVLAACVIIGSVSLSSPVYAADEEGINVEDDFQEPLQEDFLEPVQEGSSEPLQEEIQGYETQENVQEPQDIEGAQNQLGMLENSWRYQNGERIDEGQINGSSSGISAFALPYSYPWQKVDGYYRNTKGDPILGAIKKGIDVSEWQGTIDWNKVKADGIDFAIIRCGYGNNDSRQDDLQWSRNVSECERLGIPYGVYIYSYATDTSMAKSEADHVLRLISGRKLSYPVYFDMEDNSTVNTSKDMKGAVAQTFCDTISAAGYKVGIYANLDWFNNYLTSPVFQNGSWSKWVAQYNSTCDYSGTYDIWQCTSTGQVAGINGGTDLNFQMSDMTSTTPPEETPIPPAGVDSVLYATHVEDYGWQDWKSNGEMSGTQGKSKRLEGIYIKLNTPGVSGNIKYRTHIQDYGWQSWKSNGEMSGTQGQSKRLEAIEIQLEGQVAEKYDIYYRVHVQDYGWLDWAKNGNPAGSSSFSKRLEGIEIRLVAKGSAAPGATSRPYVHAPIVKYQTHVQNSGWLEYVQNGALSGTVGKSQRLEGIKISLSAPECSGNIEYLTHIQDYGWETSWKSNGAMSGTERQSKRLEAIRIRLTGEIANRYDVYYRVHIQDYGWLGWAKNGNNAGSSGKSKRLECIQVVLVKKGGNPPGTTKSPYL